MTDGTVSGEELAAFLGISDRMVRELSKRGHVSRAKRGRYHFTASVSTYCQHLRGIAAGRGGDDHVTTLTAERARLAREQADSAALKNAVLRGSMVAVVDVEREWIDVLRTVRASMLAVSSRLQLQLPRLGNADLAAIDKEIRFALVSLVRNDHQSKSEKDNRIADG